MKYAIFIPGILLFLVLLTFCDTKPLASADQNPPEVDWHTIDSLMDRGMMRSALEEVEEVVRRFHSVSDDNPNKIKAAVYLSRLTAETEDDFYLEYTRELTTQRSRWSQPGRSILSWYLADAYERYLRNNRWKIRERSIGTDVPDDRPEFWSTEQFVDKISNLYLESVQWSGLKEYTIDSFRPLVSKREFEVMDHLSLYEMLGHHATEYFSSPARYVSRPTYAFLITDPVVFQDRNEFARWEIQTRDTASFDFRALRLYQDLLSQYGTSQHFTAVLTDLDRLRFAHQQAELDGKDSLYYTALERIAGQCREDSVYSTVRYRQASFLHDHPEQKDAWKRSLDLCEQAIEAYPESSGADHSRNLKAKLLQEELSLQIPEADYPEFAILCKASWRNLPSFHWNVYRLNEKEWTELQSSPDRMADFEKMNKSPVEQGMIDLPDEGDLMFHEVEWGLPALEQGQYVLTARADIQKKPDRRNIQMFQVTPWAVSMYRDEEHSFLRVTDRMSGSPVSAVMVELYHYERQGRTGSSLVKFAEFETNEEGEVVLNSLRNKNFRVSLRKGNRVYISDGMLNTYRREREHRPVPNTYFFTDRALYRPGQTVHFKALATHEQEGEFPELLKNKTVRITLRDANHREINQVHLKTNEYGSVQGSFVLPEHGLTGRFMLESSMGRSRKFIRVEEYKRPSFEVNLKEAKTAYSLGDTIEIRGTAANYAGNPVDGGEVRWQVVRQRYIYRPWEYGYFPPPGGREERIIALGDGRTSRDGTFTVRFPLDASGGSSSRGQEVFSYQIEAEVTDLQGETHNAIRTIRAGRKPFYWKIEHEKRYSFQEPDSLTVRSLNWEGQGVSNTGSLALQLLEQPARVLRDRQWDAPDRHIMEREEFMQHFPHDPYEKEHLMEEWPVARTIQKTAINTNQDGSFPWVLPRDLPEGTYRMVLENERENVRLVRHFQWHSVHSDMSATDLLTLDAKSTRVLPGKSVEVFLSSALEQLPLIVRIKRMNRPVEIKHITLEGKEILNIPITEGDRGGISIDVSGNALNRSLSRNLRIDVPWTNKKLDIHWTRIRDELLPGQETEWTLQITAPEQKAAKAEFLATLYDASLDAIEKNSWSIPGTPGLRYYPGTYFLDFGIHPYHPFHFRPHFRQASEPVWPDFEQPPFMYYRTILRSDNYEEEAVMMPPGQDADKKTAAEAPEESVQPDEPEEPEEATLPPLRENFDETVFFFPQLQTDENGTVQLNFTMNEALTRWRLMGFAHSEDLKMGRTEKDVVTRQDFMVFPNLPRFLREGDRIRLAAKVVNSSDKTLRGHGRLVLTDLTSGRERTEAWIKSPMHPPFEIESGRSGAVHWTLQVPEEFKGVLQVEVLGTAGEFTDGERHILPVVSEDMLVTETLPLPVGSAEEKQFHFKGMDDLPEGSNPHRFTLEFTPNPAWYAVKALPWLTNPKSDNSEQIFNQLFANELAAHIANTHPAMEQVFELWRQDEDALESELLKNQELKTALLEETPWVMDALRESEQRKQIARLFEPNQIRYTRDNAVGKLKDFQLPSGAFPWFKGGRDNFYMSLYLLEGFGRLRSMGLLEQHSGVQEIIKELIPYCDEAAMEWFEQYWDRETDDMPPYILMLYLKARSDFLEDHPLPETSDELSKTVFTQIGNRWQDLNLYGQGLSVLIMHRYAFEQTAKHILASIEERALYDDEMGMYWRSDPGYYWYQRPIERHVLLMQCFHEMRGAGDAYEQMRIWLLKQKQTQHWESSKSTAAAVYALLMRGEDWLSDQKQVVVRLGGEAIETEPSEAEAGSGYFKKSWEPDAIESDFSEIAVDNPNDHIAWGAAYYQYFAPMSEISASDSEDWSIHKSYYHLKMTDEGTRRIPLSDDEPLEVGDKILVRLEVRTDRTANYVHIKDMRVSGMEPVKQKSGYQWKEGVGYYENPKDLATHFFMDYMPKGTYVFEYELYAAQSGTFAAGTASIQCYYAPEFSAHSAGSRISIEE